MSLRSTQVLNTTVTHSFSYARAIENIWEHLGDIATTFTSFVPGTSYLARTGVIRTLRNIEHGQLTVITDGEVLLFGNIEPYFDSNDLKATLIVRDEYFWRRLVLFGDLGFAEGYMEGQIDCSDIASLLRIFLANRSSLSGLGDSLLPIFTLGRRLTASKFLGDTATSRANNSAHYDLSNNFFSAFLSEDMNYSSALFMDYNEDLRSDVTKRETLEEAQLRRMRGLLNKLRIRPGDRVLEIGTGWGSLAILAAQSVECKIDAILLSTEQKAFSESRIAAAGLESRITVHLMDFRSIMAKPEWHGAFDRFICVETIEHVGRAFHETYWEVVDWAMKPKATGVAQCITMPEARLPAYDDADVDFIQKWVSYLPNTTYLDLFPGCYIPSLNLLFSTMTRGSSGRLTVDSVSNIGPHYARTLREWKVRFLGNWETLIKPTLRDEYGLADDDLDIFKRKWIYYFDYCDAGFSTRHLGDHILTFTREGNVDFGCDVDPSLIRM